MPIKTLPLALGLGLTILTGCQHVSAPVPAPLSLTPAERAKIQTHAYTGSYDVVFAATIAVLQDRGWRLESVDKPAGLIRANTAKRAESLGPEDEKTTDLKSRQEAVKLHADVSRKWSRWTELVIHTEPWPAGQVRQRIVMNQRGVLPAMSYAEEQGGTLLKRGRMVMVHAPPEEQTVEVALPEAYGDLFERIEKALRERQSAPSRPDAA